MDGRRSYRVLGFAGIVVLAVLFWRYGIRDNLTPENFGVVREGQIFRSAELTPAAMRQVVERYGIRTVVDLGANEAGTRGERRQWQTATALGLTRHVMDLEGDGSGNPNYYVAALQVMTNPDCQPVLVHCAAGTQRTGCLTMLYRKVVEGVPYEQSLAEARRYGHDPEDNPKVLEMLEVWGPKIEAAFREGRWIPEAPPPWWLEPAGAPGEPSE